jgi:hypothetical protein
MDVQRIEKVDHVCRVIINGCRRRIAGAGAETTELRQDETPTISREGKLRVPHGWIERKAVDQDEGPTRAAAAARGDFDVTESTEARHGRLCYVRLKPDATAGR